MLTCKPALGLWKEVTAPWTLQPSQTKSNAACLRSVRRSLSGEPTDFETKSEAVTPTVSSQLSSKQT